MKSLKRVFIPLLLMAMMLGGFCQFGNTALAAKKVVKAKSIKLNTSVCTIKKGGKIRLKATISPKKSTQKKVVWKSSNKKIAAVTSKGVVKGIKNGKAMITATVKGTKKTAKCNLIVGTPVKKLTVQSKNITLKVNEKVNVKATVSPKNATTKKLRYQSGNKAVATVSTKGEVTAKSIGTAKITVSTTDGTNRKAVVNVSVVTSEVSVAGVTLSHTEATLNKGATLQLTASINPATATNQSLTWSSGNPGVATVSNNGFVTAVAAGTSDITVVTSNGLKAVCKITVTSNVTVATQEELNRALMADYDKIIIQTNQAGTFNIAQGDYSKCALVINSPNLEVVNQGKFASIEISAIAPNTFTENAVGNTILMNAQDGRILVGGTGNPKINIGKSCRNSTIENNGLVTEMNVESEGTVSVKGESNQRIPVNVTGKATIDAHKSIQLSLFEKIRLIIRSGAIDTSITANTRSNVPHIQGLGMFQVNLSDIHDVETVVAENVNLGDNVNEVTMNGKVVDIATKEGVAGANMTLVPYVADFDVNKLDDYVTTKVVSGDDGSYTFNGVRTGNYILVGIMDGYEETTQVTVVVPSHGNVYYCGEMELFPENPNAEPGGVSGTIVNATDGLSVSELTVRIRRNKNNLTGTVLKETKTNANGVYEFSNLPQGNYTVEVIDRRALSDEYERFIPAYFNAYVIGGEVTGNQGTAVSQLIRAGKFRIILTWGNEESGASKDLDSHLVGPSADGSGIFHVYWENKSYGDYVDLDVDDMYWEGPETITIREVIPGVYDYFIHDFTNEYDEDSDQLSRSQAVVTVINEFGNEIKFNVPSGVGNIWHVFRYDSITGQITQINTLNYDYSDEWEDILWYY